MGLQAAVKGYHPTTHKCNNILTWDVPYIEKKAIIHQRYGSISDEYNRNFNQQGLHQSNPNDRPASPLRPYYQRKHRYPQQYNDDQEDKSGKDLKEKPAEFLIAEKDNTITLGEPSKGTSHTTPNGNYGMVNVNGEFHNYQAERDYYHRQYGAYMAIPGISSQLSGTVTPKVITSGMREGINEFDKRYDNIPTRIQTTQPTCEKFDYEMTHKEKFKKTLDEDLMKMHIDRD